MNSVAGRDRKLRVEGSRPTPVMLCDGHCDVGDVDGASGDQIVLAASQGACGQRRGVCGGGERENHAMRRLTLPIALEQGPREIDSGATTFVEKLGRGLVRRYPSVRCLRPAWGPTQGRVKEESCASKWTVIAVKATPSV